MNIDLRFVLETLVVTIILTSYVTYVNFSQRKKMHDKMDEECKENLAFSYRHPYWNILITFAAFFILTFLMKLLHDVIFT